MPDLMSPQPPDVHMFRMPNNELASVEPEDVIAAAEEIANSHYIDAISAADNESVAVEDGVPLTPIREGGGPVNAVEAGGAEPQPRNAVDTGREFTYTDNGAVLNAANQGVAHAYAAATEAVDHAAIEAHKRQAHIGIQQISNATANLRNQALGVRNDYELTA